MSFESQVYLVQFNLQFGVGCQLIVERYEMGGRGENDVAYYAHGERCGVKLFLGHPNPDAIHNWAFAVAEGHSALDRLLSFLLVDQLDWDITEALEAIEETLAAAKQTQFHNYGYSLN